GDHDAPESVIRIERKERSRSAGTSDQDASEPALIADIPFPALETSQPSGARAKNERSESAGFLTRETIERHAASENPLRATTINDFAKLGTALGGRPTIVERLPSQTIINGIMIDGLRVALMV